jgi:hypothetical protein
MGIINRKAKEREMNMQRYTINPDKSVDSTFWIEDINGDWIRETDGNRYIYRHRPIKQEEFSLEINKGE